MPLDPIRSAAHEKCSANLEIAAQYAQARGRAVLISLCSREWMDDADLHWRPARTLLFLAVQGLEDRAPRDFFLPQPPRGCPTRFALPAFFRACSTHRVICARQRNAPEKSGACSKKLHSGEMAANASRMPSRTVLVLRLGT